mgnify:FL=1
MIFLERDYLRVWVDRSIKLMYSEWRRPVSSEEYRDGNTLLLEHLQNYGVVNWIADSAHLGDITVEDENWTLQHLVPGFTQTLLQKIARVSGHDNSSHTKFENFARRAEDLYIGPIQVRQFITYKEAADWIGDIIA